MSFRTRLECVQEFVRQNSERGGFGEWGGTLAEICQAIEWADIPYPFRLSHSSIQRIQMVLLEEAEAKIREANQRLHDPAEMTVSVYNSSHSVGGFPGKVVGVDRNGSGEIVSIQIRDERLESEGQQWRFERILSDAMALDRDCEARSIWFGPARTFYCCDTEAERMLTYLCRWKPPEEK